jgi:hypothetical protein
LTVSGNLLHNLGPDPGEQVDFCLVIFKGCNGIGSSFNFSTIDFQGFSCSILNVRRFIIASVSASDVCARTPQRLPKQKAVTRVIFKYIFLFRRKANFP